MVKSFFDWCNLKEIDILKITRMQAENYLYFLCTKYSSNSARSMILSVSSFYSFLENRHDIIKNRFYKLDLPTIKLTRRIDVVEEEDIDCLKKELNRIGRKDIVCCVDLLSKYGFRVGIFENMKIDNNGNWNSVSKEKSYKGKFTKSEVKTIKESGLLMKKIGTIKQTVCRYTKKLYERGIISCSFSCHDLRHYRITQDIKNEDIDKLIKISRKYHKNINTTLGYVNL